MKKSIVFFLSALFLNSFAFAGGGEEDSLKIMAQRIREYERLLDSVDRTMKYETGKVSLPGGIAELNVPGGFKYLNKEQSNFILTDIWGNPPQQGVLGMIFPANSRLASDSTYAFVITFDEMGYVKDKDANDVNYDDLLKEMKKEETSVNAKRATMGYEPIHIIGWAQKPFYDNTNKVLHWAKEMKFGTSEENTLNYDIRILGRKGVLSLNAVGSMFVLPSVKKDIDKVLTMASFTAGNRYQDFDSKSDNVAAWTVGGLVAGKIIAKAGGFKLLKVIILAIVAAIGAAWKWITGRRKKKEDELAYQPVNTVVPEENNNTPAN
jgi:uncharacterized membrane-anchored protein